MKKLILLALLSGPAWGGPYVEVNLDYDPRPVFDYTIDNGIENRTEASHYIGIASTGWEWDVDGYISDEDSLTVRLKLFEHRSDIRHEGSRDVVSKNEIRGVSVKYRFW